MQYDKTILFEILDRVLRSWWTLVAAVCVGAACAVCAMHYLPKVYQATTRIFVAPQKIPQEFVRTTVVDDMSLRMASLEQAVLSRPYLAKLIETDFQPLPATTEEMERLILSIRSRVLVLVTSGVFEISFRDVDPQRAARVVNTLADTYIEENSKYRASRAGETTKTIQEFAARVRRELEAQEGRIADFKAAHLYETADRQQANFQLLASRQKDLEAREADLAAAKDAVRIFDEMAAQPEFSRPASGGGASPATGGNRAAVLEREIKALKLRYSDEHPQVKAKQRELDELRAAAKVEAQNPTPAAPAENAAANSLKEQRATMQTQVQELESELRKIRADIAAYEKRIEETPRVEAQLQELSKGYDVLVEQYKSYQSKVEGAKSAQELEENRKGEQFEVIERALPPVLPIQPVPLTVFGMGIASGLLAFVGPVVIRTLLRPLISSEAGLRALAPAVPVLVNIPRLLAPDMVRRDHRRRLANVGLSVVSAALLGVAVVVFR